MAGENGRVQDSRPPHALVRRSNRLVGALLRSPAHRLMDRRCVLLIVRGRRTGREYAVPVGRNEVDGELWVSGGGRWRYNLRGGADVRPVVDGLERTGHADMDEDPDRVAEAFATLLRRGGRRSATRLGLRIRGERLPSVEELKPALVDRAIIRIRLTDG